METGLEKLKRKTAPYREGQREYVPLGGVSGDKTIFKTLNDDMGQSVPYELSESIENRKKRQAASDKAADDATANRKEAERDGARYAKGGMVRRGYGKARGA